MTVRHKPVMLEQVLAALAPKDRDRIIDGTFGAGGYSRALLDAAEVRVLALDRDPTAVAGGAAMVERYGPRLSLVEARFSAMAEVAARSGFDVVDAVVLDIGVSSMQLDEPGRGFSFQSDGPLDMRMGNTGPSAADVVNEADEALLADILYHLGEERRARPIARAIVSARRSAPIRTTRELAGAIERVVGRRHDEDRHPATRAFQALRIYVNDELGELADALVAAEHVLAPGGRLAVVTFHSLEDRLVKRFLSRRSGRTPTGSRYEPPRPGAAARPSFQIINQKPLTPDQAEVAANPRSRSAKLRVAVRTAAGAMPAEEPGELGLPLPGIGR